MSGLVDGESAASIGAALKQAREARGLSEVQIGEAINLRATVVRAIERDDFTLCGGDVYARGHLRAYAKQVGMDAEPLLATFAEQRARERAAVEPDRGHRPASRAVHPPVARPPARGAAGVPAAAEAQTADPHSAQPQATEAQPTSRPQPAAAKPAKAAPAVVKGPVPPLGARPGGTWRSKDVPLERSRPSAALVIGAVLAALMVFLVVQVVSNLRSPGRGTSQVAGPTMSTSAAHPPATGTTGATPPASTPSTIPSPTSTRTTTAPPGVAVALSLIGDSWVSVRDASGHEMFSGLLGKGESRRFSDGKGLRLTLGNAGAVRLTVNGKSIGSAGGKGQVVRLNFGPKDPA